MSPLRSTRTAGLTSVVLSSIERRYQFTSVMTGLIASTVDITIALCIIPVSYFGGRGNKPRWLGVGAILLGVGALVFALPQFVVGPYQPDRLLHDGVEVCSGELTAVECPETSPSWVSGAGYHVWVRLCHHIDVELRCSSIFRLHK